MRVFTVGYATVVFNGNKWRSFTVVYATAVFNGNKWRAFTVGFAIPSYNGNLEVVYDSILPLYLHFDISTVISIKNLPLYLV